MDGREAMKELPSFLVLLLLLKQELLLHDGRVGVGHGRLGGGVIRWRKREEETRTDVRCVRGNVIRGEAGVVTLERMVRRVWATDGL